MFTVTVKMSLRYIWIGSPLTSPMPKAGPRRGRGQQHVDLLEGLLKVARDERAHLLRLDVVGVVVAGREHVGADQDAPAHLRAEARRARAS